MNVRVIPSVRLLTRRCILGLCTLFACATIPVSADEYSTTCNYSDEPCGWVEPSSEQATPGRAMIIEKSVATLATAAGAGTGVAFQQFVEPFAMVGPYFDQSRQMVRAFQEWWESMSAIAKERDRADTEKAIAAIAKLEPIDADLPGLDLYGVQQRENVAIEQRLTPGITVTPINSLVGSAPMIVTIDEPYTPYDLSVSDIRLRSVFPMTIEPFCVRSRAENWSPVPMWTEVEQLQLAKLEKKKVLVAVDAYLEELVYMVDSWAQSRSKFAAVVSPNLLGERLAGLVHTSSKIMLRATDMISMHWPEPIAKPSAAGRALLTRAGVDAGINHVESTTTVIARAGAGSSLH